MHTFRERCDIFLIVGGFVLVYCCLSGSRGGMTRFVSCRFLSLLLSLLLSLPPSPCLTGREKEQTGSAALLPASSTLHDPKLTKSVNNLLINIHQPQLLKLIISTRRGNSTL